MVVEEEEEEEEEALLWVGLYVIEEDTTSLCS